MISNRTYRLGLGLDKALEELDRCKGSQFDAVVVDCFHGLIDALGKDAFCHEYCSHITNEGGKS
jgi:HD-GYP domain-containing protein (c-di-GMP phosphodiesterase class II)